MNVISRIVPTRLDIEKGRANYFRYEINYGFERCFHVLGLSRNGCFFQNRSIRIIT